MQYEAGMQIIFDVVGKRVMIIFRATSLTWPALLPIKLLPLRRVSKSVENSDGARAQTAFR